MRRAYHDLAVRLAGTFAVAAIVACGRPDTTPATEPVQHTGTATVPIAPPAPTPGIEQDATQFTDEARGNRPLKLTIDDPALDTGPAASFGKTHDPDWLDPGAASTSLDEAPASKNLLPDLFDSGESEKAISVKGEVLLDSEAAHAPEKIGGVGVTVRMRTD